MKHEWDYVQGGKTSVKIHNAPGGNSQWSIGWGNDEPPKNQGYQKSYNDQVQTYQSSYQKDSYNGYYGQVPADSIQYAGAATKNQQYQPPVQNSYAGGSITGGGGRAKVPQYQEQLNQRQEKQYNHSGEKTSVKLHAPPGGVSSISFGYEEPPAYKAAAFKQQDMNKDQWGGPSNQDYAFGGYGKKQQQQQPAQMSKAHQQTSNIFGSQGNNFGYDNQPSWSGFSNYEQQQQKGYGGNQAYGKQNNRFDQQYDNPIFGGRHQERSPPRGVFQNNMPSYKQDEPVFGQRVDAGNNCGPTTDKSSVKLHAPPGGKSSIQFF